MNKYDKRRKYYLILDCETATLPEAIKYSENERKNIAIAKPLIYDLGWQVVDKLGRVYAKKNYLITEIFTVPEVFNTAYYREKRPLYIGKLNRGEIQVVNWRTAVNELVEDMQACEAVGAYNSMFDFKKAIPFTELYINNLYSEDFHRWLDFQNTLLPGIARNRGYTPKKEFEGEVFRFRGESYPLFDLWGLSCKHILNCDEYRQMCWDNGWLTASGKYYKTSAETAYRFVANDGEFIEAHTAIDDAVIESELFAHITKKTKNNFEMGIIYFPFRIVGKID